MSVQNRPCRTRYARAPRAVGAALAGCLVASACGTATGGADIALAPPASPGQAAGTVIVAAGTDPTAALKTVQDAITAGGGTVAATVDHAADVKAAGVTIAGDTVVIGGPPSAGLPMLRIDQRAALNLPQRYLVRQGTDGAVTVTSNGPDYIAAVSGVDAPAAVTALRDASTAVIAKVAPSAAGALASPLLGVSPVNYVLSVFGSSDVPSTVERLRKAASKAPSKVVGVIDMAAGSATPGPAIRPTSVVLVSTPAVEAALLAAAPSFGLEVPMRYVVWVDDQNRTLIGYPDVRRIAARHGLPVTDANVVRMATDADLLARAAAGILR